MQGRARKATGRRLMPRNLVYRRHYARMEPGKGSQRAAVMAGPRSTPKPALAAVHARREDPRPCLAEMPY
jgi:hypothetical protein